MRQQSQSVTVTVHLPRIRAEAEQVVRTTGVGLIPVIKADAYGLGATRVAEALADVADAFFVFSLEEAARDQIHRRTGRPVLALALHEEDDADAYTAHGVRPVVWTTDQAARLAAARPVLSVDTGQQRFACPAHLVPDAVRAGAIDEALTHASTLLQIDQFKAIMATGPAAGVTRLHAAGSSLLSQPHAWLHAVRPGLSLYRHAVRVATRLFDVRDGTGPAGYSGFVSPRHGVILAGYSHGLRKGICHINGRPRRILEVGMQSSFVETGPRDRAGDEVVLLGEGLGAAQVAEAWQTGQHEVIVRLAGMGQRTHVDP